MAEPIKFACWVANVSDGQASGQSPQRAGWFKGECKAAGEPERQHG